MQVEKDKFYSKYENPRLANPHLLEAQMDFQLTVTRQVLTTLLVQIKFVTYLLTSFNRFIGHL